MRILYGVFGYGRGHATRALSILPELRERHEVVVLAGGDAYDAIAPDHPVVRILTAQGLTLREWRLLSPRVPSARTWRTWPTSSSGAPVIATSCE